MTNRAAPTRPNWIPTLWGRSLRFVLVERMMRAGGPVTVAEMVADLAESGFELHGRASKVISDALRWEVRRGRVVRLGRGVYQYRAAPRSTARRIRLFARRARAWIDAARRGEPTPPTPPDPRREPGKAPIDPAWPPWARMGWLWVR